ncbi:MAG: hypothetical protein ACLU30_01850 [Odoribacter splanchnicus]
MSFQILTINPGSTSTKIAIFEDEKEIFSKTLRHTAEELSPYATVASQFQFRKNIILSDCSKQVGTFTAFMQSLAEAV